MQKFGEKSNLLEVQCSEDLVNAPIVMELHTPRGETKGSIRRAYML